MRKTFHTKKKLSEMGLEPGPKWAKFIFSNFLLHKKLDKKILKKCFRLWIGVWVGVILLIMVATDASAFVCYITRFTEENFATLIAVIFIIKAVGKFFFVLLDFYYKSIL